MFIQAYQDWKPEKMEDSNFYDQKEMRSAGPYNHSIAKEVKLTEGHPFRFVRGFMNV